MSAQSNVIPLSFGNRQRSDDDVLVHVRFYPNSDVATISDCPVNFDKVEWYKLLRMQTVDCYQVHAGMRGFFRIAREEYEAIVRAAGARFPLQAAE